MLYQYSQKLPSNAIKGVYKITTHDKAIGTFWWFVSDVLARSMNKKRHKQFISNWYEYQWEPWN